ncbi:MAG: TIGR03619 family F420-dependent LLM class oxidoreductase [Acidimicrobiales bacterium]
MRFWCGTAFMGTREMPAVARMLDEAGYHGVLMSDHLIYPRALSSPYPGTPDGRVFWPPETAWPDSWVMIGAMAAVTEHQQFGNNVFIAPARPILEVAKQVATASVLSGGRVSLGLAAGWMREEFELLGQDFDDRGRRLDEMIDALRELWKGGWVSWKGEHYDIPELMLEPHPESTVPILCGGESEAALRRAARSCDGWVGTAYPLEVAAEIVARLRSYRCEYGRDGEPFDVIVALRDEPSPDLYQRAEELGITGTMCAPWAGGDLTRAGDHADLVEPAERHRGAIERFAEQIVARCP